MIKSTQNQINIAEIYLWKCFYRSTFKIFTEVLRITDVFRECLDTPGKYCFHVLIVWFLAVCIIMFIFAVVVYYFREWASLIN